MARIYCPDTLVTGQSLTLPREASRHIQVLRLQPGLSITLFNGQGGEYAATIDAMGRQAVDVTVGSHDPVEREPTGHVHLAVCMPANERMDWLVEKATELGVQHITPLMGQRNVVRLSGERAEKRRAHWTAIAIGACEQSGRNRLPQIDAPIELGRWLGFQSREDSGLPVAHRVILSLADAAPEPTPARHQATRVLIGPEGGFSSDEEALAIEHGFKPHRMGTRVLRTETAAIAATLAFSDRLNLK